MSHRSLNDNLDRLLRFLQERLPGDAALRECRSLLSAATLMDETRPLRMISEALGHELLVRLQTADSALLRQDVERLCAEREALLTASGAADEAVIQSTSSGIRGIVRQLAQMDREGELPEGTEQVLLRHLRVVAATALRLGA
jgi:hypothetical protein